VADPGKGPGVPVPPVILILPPPPPLIWRSRSATGYWSLLGLKGLNSPVFASLTSPAAKAFLLVGRRRVFFLCFRGKCESWSKRGAWVKCEGRKGRKPLPLRVAQALSLAKCARLRKRIKITPVLQATRIFFIKPRQQRNISKPPQFKCLGDPSDSLNIIFLHQQRPVLFAWFPRHHPRYTRQQTLPSKRAKNKLRGGKLVSITTRCHDLGYSKSFTHIAHRSGAVG